jgi:hypothetical protein
MKSLKSILALILMLSLSVSLKSQSSYHQIDGGDVAELNKLAAALNVSGLEGWPVSAEEKPNYYPTVYGVGFLPTDTTTKTLDDKLITVYHYKVKSIRLAFKEFSGTLPPLSISELEELDLKFNNITGGIPAFDFPKCKTLNFMGNQLSGNIPAMDHPELLTLNLAQNQFSGTIPNFNLPKLHQLFLHDNSLEGSLPAFNLPELESLYASNNNLSGDIPVMQVPNLKHLQLENNQLTGTLQPLTPLAKLEYILLTNNQLGGEIPNFNMPEMANLALGDNNLTGTIPSFNMPKLLLINLKNNNVSGEFNNSGLPELRYLYLQNNQISGLPALTSASPLIVTVNVAENKLTFEDLEPNADIPGISYSPQKTVPCNIKLNGNNAEVWVEVGGSQNTYIWYRTIGEETKRLEEETENPLVTAHTPGASYHCYVQSVLVPGLTIKSEKSKLRACITASNFEFCLEDGEWKDEDGNKVGASGKVIVNNLLIFEGTLTLDTLQLELAATGEFYVENIPVGSDGKIGKFSFGTGTYDLKLLGEDGVITDFLGAKMDELGQLCGIDLKLKKMELVGGRNASGIKLDCMIGIPGISGACGDEGEDKNSEFDLNGLSITTEGISLEGVKITDLGLIVDGYCLKELSMAYDSQKDIFTSGAEVALPFGTIGGGFKIEQGYLDSIAWLLEADYPVFVLGSTTVRIKGFEGHISDITKKNVEIELKGIFTDILSDDLYRIKAGGRTKWPVEFEISGEGEFLKPPFDENFQVKGGVGVSYNIPDYLFNVKFNGNMGTPDGETWLVQSNGDFKICFKDSTPVFSGELNGNIHIEKFFEDWPYNYLNTTFGLPLYCETSNQFEVGKNKLVRGIALFEKENIGNAEIKYKLNLDKKYGESGFLDWELNAALKSAQLKNAPLAQELRETFEVPENTAFSIIGVTNASGAPATTLKSPSGDIYAESHAGDKIIYGIDSVAHNAFWTIFSPDPGTWELTIENAGENDSIVFAVQPVEPDFEIGMTQTGNEVEVTWNGNLFSASDTLYFLLDENPVGYDGFIVAKSPGNLGNYRFNLSETLGSCSYYLFAQGYPGYSVLRDYADEMVVLYKTALAPPEIVDASFHDEQNKVIVNFEGNDDPNTLGYALRVWGNETDSVYAILNSNDTSAEIDLPDYDGKWIQMTAFNYDGVTGCPSASVPIYLTGIDENGANPVQQRFEFYPNPTSGRGTMRFTMENPGKCEIKVFDINGRIAAHPVSKKYEKGSWEETWNFGDLPNGMYIFIMQTSDAVNSFKCILNK